MNNIDRNHRLNRRFEKIVERYRALSAYNKTGFKGLPKASSKKSPTRIQVETVVRYTGTKAKAIREARGLGEYNPSPFGSFNGVVPQQCSDNRPYKQTGSDEQNNYKDWRNPGSDNLDNKSGRTMEEEVSTMKEYSTDNEETIVDDSNSIAAITEDSMQNSKEIKEGITIIDILRKEREVIDLTINDGTEYDYRPHDECQYFINKQTPILHQFIKILNSINKN